MPVQETNIETSSVQIAVTGTSEASEESPPDGGSTDSEPEKIPPIFIMSIIALVEFIVIGILLGVMADRNKDRRRR